MVIHQAPNETGRSRNRSSEKSELIGLSRSAIANILKYFLGNKFSKKIAFSTRKAAVWLHLSQKYVF